MLRTFTELLIWVLLLSSGQLFFKIAADHLRKDSAQAFVLSLITSKAFWAALVIYGIATLLWIFILSHTPLRLAYPFSALSFFVVPLLARYFFNEPLSLSYFLGLSLIASGLFVIAFSKQF